MNGTSMRTKDDVSEILRSWAGREPSEVALRISMIVAAVSLIFSMFSMWQASSAMGELRDTQSRLACLELPGSNACPPIR